MEGLLGTKTKKNLIHSVIEKKKAVKQYTILGQKARRQGYPLIQKFLDNVAAQEQIHASIYLDFLEDYEVPVAIDISNWTADEADLIKSLHAAAKEEADLYKAICFTFSSLANAEGFKQIATTFELVGKIDAEHSRRLVKIASELEAETLFKKTEPISWYCQVCGNSHFGVLAPTVCEVCHHLKGYFQAGNIG